MSSGPRTNVVTILLPYPVSTNALYGNSAKGRRKSEAGLSFANEAGWAARLACPEPLSGHIAVNITYRPETAPGIDLDNICKCTLDALTGIAWLDDSQIWSLHVERRFYIPGRTLEICISADRAVHWGS